MLTKLTKKYINAFNDKNLNELETLFDENFALEDPVVKRIEGKEECLQAIKKIFEACKQLSFSAKNIFQDKNTTFIEFILVLDDMRLEGVDIIEWQDEKIIELRAYLNVPKE
ncbi:nuclear transport factor 2 family protein [Campylobacter hepaticus]|uniref:Nuclear transport factor 2 family protein n=1 Tax=Campylobacter hepaticus TaxID=1813019 RepID=A0A6A7JU86_9BACT|nr:nuclear transport factor 2 family protein [Campylobacter hepaticus]AXP09035.1 nuclear transport factor 2 family protein [Campylobacter hepaticus]MCZ0771923.1 nuclear transport factor 2 family protein [Campylobacter hepaticus]MCZ0773392.1 nuclear transport factor 2 family protein [Campylobacter hepaticus]MCZ0774643.1 nuclear transport factor 2 family protein [Campylobacter hepaticus]MDX2323988.1 nuclear transport factor 2 family protein [Campylobacter hepaticus]